MIEQTLTAKLETITPQVFPLKAPEDAEGAMLIYQRTSTERETHLSGPSGIAVSYFRVDVYQQAFSEVVTLSNALRVACDGWQEDDVLYCSIESDIDFDADADEDGYYRRSMELRITHRES